MKRELKRVLSIAVGLRRVGSSLFPDEEGTETFVYGEPQAITDEKVLVQILQSLMINEKGKAIEVGDTEKAQIRPMVAE